MVEELQQQSIDVKLSCELLGVSRSGFYAWLKRPSSERAEKNRALIARIRVVHNESRQTYGAPRVHAALKNNGVACGKNRVAKLMRANELSAKPRKRFKVKTTDSNHELPIARRVFEAERAAALAKTPNQVWASDITYIDTEEGWLFLAVFMDIYTRKIVGYSMRNNLRTELVLNALEMAIGRQGKPESDLVIHSDRGVQYAAGEFRERLKELEFTPSMSRKANCYDNAFVESFFKTLKTELVYRTKFQTRKEAEKAIFEYIEVFYNRERLHSSLGYKTPERYEQMAA